MIFQNILPYSYLTLNSNPTLFQVYPLIPTLNPKPNPELNPLRNEECPNFFFKLVLTRMEKQEKNPKNNIDKLSSTDGY